MKPLLVCHSYKLFKNDSNTIKIISATFTGRLTIATESIVNLKNVNK